MNFREDDEVRAIFIEETKTHLISLENGVLQLEQQPDRFNQTVVDSLFRAAHSIKAAANLLGYKNIEGLTNALENILDQFRRQKRILTIAGADHFLEAVDTIREMIMVIQYSDEIDISPLMNKLKQFSKSEN